MIEAENYSKTINTKKLTYFQSIFNKFKKNNDWDIEREGKLTHPGCSGSPWIIKNQNNQQYYLLGTHIGKVIAYNPKLKVISEIAYVKPIQI